MTTDTLAAEGRRLLQAATKPDRKVFWRCFHCGETFTKAQERWAREHFGDDEGERPVCQMRLPGEHHLLTALRKAQRELRRYRSEDTDLMRAIYAMRSDHAAALRSEEERGYSKGVADMTAEAEHLRSLLKEAGEGLGPFAAVAVEAGDKQSDDACWCGQNGAVIRYSDLRKARSLFTKIREVLGSASLRAEADNGQG